MAEIINIKNEAGEVQYPVTKPECVIDENGKNVLDLIRESGGGESYDDTEIREDIAELQQKDAEQSAKLTELSEEISKVNGKKVTYTRLATGSILDLTPPLKEGCDIISFTEVTSISLYDEQQNKVVVSADNLPFRVDKTYPSWVAYKSGNPQVTMVVDFNGEIVKLKEADASLSAEVSESIAEVSNEVFIADKMKGTLAELYIIAPKNEGTLLAVKHYNNDIFVRYGTNLINNETFDNDANGWQCRMSLSTMKENEIIPLLCTTASTSLGVAKGDVIGYIIFKDLEKFKSVSVQSVGFLADDNKCRDIRYSPVIHTSLLPKQEGNIASLVSGVNIYIPSTITAVVGDTMQIFWRSIVSARNPYIFDIVALGAVGKSYPRYFSFTPTSDQVGQTYVMKFCVRDNDGNDIVTKDVSIKVVAKASNPSTKKKVLCVGASATAGGQWVGELKRRLVETSGNGTAANPEGLGLTNYEFVGRKVGTSNPVNLEATGGWTIRSYASAGYKAIRFQVVDIDTLAIGATYKVGSTTYTIQEVNVTNGSGNIRCTVSSYSAPSSSGTLVKASGNGDATITYTSYQEENYSPFWNSSEGKIDFQSYANEYCGGSIDILIWHCGINDLANGGDMELTYSAYRDLLRAYHEQFPSGKVIISSVPIGSVNGGFAANYGANGLMNYWTFTKATMEFASALMALCLETEFATYVRYSAAMEQFDAENGYPTSEVSVNNRSSIKEKQGTNAVHPIAEGSYQVADAIYKTFNTLLWPEGSVEIDMVAHQEGIYLNKTGGFVATASPRTVAIYPIEEGKHYDLYVPQTGNSYASIYAYTNTTNIVAGTINSYPTGVGDEKEANVQFTAISGFAYLVVCYTTKGGIPTLKKL